MPIEVYMPKMSDHMEAGLIMGWLVTEGDAVTAGQAIIEVETDKTVAEIEAPATGFIKGIRAGTGKDSSVPVGETIAFIVKSLDERVPVLPPLGEAPAEAGGSTPSDPAAPDPSPDQATEQPASGRPVRTTPFVRKRAADLGADLSLVTPTGASGRITEADLEAYLSARAVPKASPAESSQVEDSSIRATPFVRKRARDLGIDLTRVSGSGPHGRISEDDLNDFLAGQESPPLAAPPLATAATAVPHATSSLAEGAWLDLNKIQRVTGERMTLSAQTVPQFSLTVEADATNLLDLRTLIANRSGVKISVTAILLAITAGVLRQNPRGNASYVDGRIRLHSDVNIGIAVGADDGLLVPVIHHADQKTLIQLNNALVGFRDKAARRRFAAEDLMGGTFTISNLGMFGIRQFNAIVNPPESGILAVGEVFHKPICLPDRTIAVRPMMNLTLAVDHRSLDGLVAAQLLSAIKAGVEQPILLGFDRLVGEP